MRANQYPMSEIYAFLAQSYGDTSRLIVTDQAYRLDFGTLTHAVPETLPIQIQANADFLALELAIVGEELNMSATTVQITDSTAGDNFFNAACYASAVCSFPGCQNQLPWPRLIQGNSALYVTVNPSLIAGAGTTTQNNWVEILGVMIRKA